MKKLLLPFATAIILCLFAEVSRAQPLTLPFTEDFALASLSSTKFYSSSGTRSNVATYTCSASNYVRYFSSNSYFITRALTVAPGKSVSISFKLRNGGTFQNPEVYLRVSDPYTFSTTNPTYSSWVKISGTFTSSTSSCITNTLSIPSDIVGGQRFSLVFWFKNSSSTNWVAIDDLSITEVTGTTVPTTYNETFATTAWYPSAGYVSIPYHSYLNATSSQAYLWSGGITTNYVALNTSTDLNPSSGARISTREVNTSGYTNGQVTFAFRSVYPCPPSSVSWTSDEEYDLYAPEVYIMAGQDNTSTPAWTLLPVNYYFPNGTWTYATYDISAYKNTSVKLKFESGTSNCTSYFHGVDNIKILDRDCRISSQVTGTMTVPSGAILQNTDYSYSVPAVTYANYYKWMIRSGDNTYYSSSTYIKSGQGTRTPTISFGTLPGPLRVLCIPYDTDPAGSNDACYAKLAYSGTFYTCPGVLNSNTHGPGNTFAPYTIGGTTPDYAGFTEAVDALIQCGISGPVVFDVRTGTYTEQISIPEISGASTTNTITFQSETGNRGDVILTNASSSSVSDNYTLHLNGADHFRFKNMTIQRSGSNSYACVVFLESDVSDNQFTNNVLSGRTGSASTSAALVLSDDADAGNTNILFEENHFLNGSAGAWYEGTSGNLKSAITFQNNVFENYRYGLQLQYLEDVSITGNQFTNAASYNSASTQGIYAFHVDNALTVSKNTFEYTSATNNQGIELQACQGTSGTLGDVSNNMIVVGSSGTVYGINSGSTTYYKNYFYNSVYNTGTNATSSSAYYQNGSDNINFKNNALYSTAGNALEILAPTAGLVSSDYNNLYSGGSYVGNWGGTNAADLAAWKTASSRDANSVSVDPQYLSVSDLHANSGSGMANAGNPVTGITTDIDGDTRHASTPDIGADEFSGSACTPGTWTAGATLVTDKTNWFNTANWSCGTIPTASIDVVIPTNPSGGNYYPVLTGSTNAVTKSLTIDANASVTLSFTTSGTIPQAELQVNGTLTNNGVTDMGYGYLAMQTGSSLAGALTTSYLKIDGNVSLVSGASVGVKRELTLKSGTLTTAGGTLTLKSDANSTGYVNDFGANSGQIAAGNNITLERYIPSGVVNSFHYIGSAGGGTAAIWNDDFGNSANAADGTKVTPKSDCDPLALDAGSAYGNLFTYNEAQVTTCYLDGWDVRTTGAGAARGSGFAATIGAGTTLDETGAYTKSNVTLSNLSITSANTLIGISSGSNSRGFHLVANPFFAPVDWSAMVTANSGNDMDGTAYIYNPNSGTYGTYNLINSGTIPTNGAFFVRHNPLYPGSSYDVLFDASTRIAATNSNFLKQGQPYAYGLKVTAANGAYSDETLIAFDENFTDGYDNGYDAAKLLSSYGIPSLYTHDAANVSKAIEALGINTQGKTVPLALQVPGASGTYTFTFDGVADFPPTVIIWLEDLQTGTIQYLRQQNTYSFTANANDNPDRFVLHFAPELLVTATGADCSGNNGAITLEQRGGIEWAFRLHNVQGAVIASEVFSTTELVNQLAPGTYTLALTHPLSGYATTMTIEVSGLQPVTAAINATATDIFENESITIEAQTTGATTYSWQMGDGTVYTDVQSVSHAYASEGVYGIIFTANNDGCSAVSTLNISVSKQDTVSTGAGMAESGSIRIVENGDVLYISQSAMKRDADAQVTVYNALGQIIIQAEIAQMAYGATYRMPVDAAAGMYFISVKLSGGNSVLKKVLLGEGR